VRDPQEPGTHRRAAEVLQREEGPNEGLLRHVFSEVRIAEQAIGDGEDESLVATDEFGERIAIAGPCPSYQKHLVFAARHAEPPVPLPERYSRRRSFVHPDPVPQSLLVRKGPVTPRRGVRSCARRSTQVSDRCLWRERTRTAGHRHSAALTGTGNRRISHLPSRGRAARNQPPARFRGDLTRLARTLEFPRRARARSVR
jgi:hypothetical protein